MSECEKRCISISWSRCGIALRILSRLLLCVWRDDIYRYIPSLLLFCLHFRKNIDFCEKLSFYCGSKGYCSRCVVHLHILLLLWRKPKTFMELKINFPSLNGCVCLCFANQRQFSLIDQFRFNTVNLLLKGKSWKLVFFFSFDDDFP